MNTALLILQIFLISAQFAFLIVGYKLATKQFRMSKASHFLERFMSKDMIEARNTVDRLFEGNDLKSTLEYLNEKKSLKDLNQIRMFANFFQELSIAYRNRLVDKKYIIDVFDVLTCKYWTLLTGWISDYRSKSDNSLYSGWEDFRDELRSIDNDLKKI